MPNYEYLGGPVGARSRYAKEPQIDWLVASGRWQVDLIYNEARTPGGEVDGVHGLVVDDVEDGALAEGDWAEGGRVGAVALQKG